jgi:hypothetical protein
MVDNDEIGGLVVDNDEIGGHDRKMSEQVFLTNSQSEFEQEHEFFNHAEMHGGGRDAKRARQQRAKIVSERTDDAGKCTQTVLRGEALSYRTLGHPPGGTNETMIENCPSCTAGEPCQNCVRVNCQNVSNARAKAKQIQDPDLHRLQKAKRREQHAEKVCVSFKGHPILSLKFSIIISD